MLAISAFSSAAISPTFLGPERSVCTILRRSASASAFNRSAHSFDDKTSFIRQSAEAATRRGFAKLKDSPAGRRSTTAIGGFGNAWQLSAKKPSAFDGLTLVRKFGYKWNDAIIAASPKIAIVGSAHRRLRGILPRSHRSDLCRQRAITHGGAGRPRLLAPVRRFRSVVFDGPGRWRPRQRVCPDRQRGRRAANRRISF